MNSSSETTTQETPKEIALPKETGRRSTRTVTVYHPDFIRRKIGEAKPFRMKSGGVFALHESGAFVRLDKDRRSPKERKRASRAARLETERAAQ